MVFFKTNIINICNPTDTLNNSFWCYRSISVSICKHTNIHTGNFAKHWESEFHRATSDQLWLLLCVVALCPQCHTTFKGEQGSHKKLSDGKGQNTGGGEGIKRKSSYRSAVHLWGTKRNNAILHKMRKWIIELYDSMCVDPRKLILENSIQEVVKILKQIDQRMECHSTM